MLWAAEDSVCPIRDFPRPAESPEDVYLLVRLRAGDVEPKRPPLSGLVWEVTWLSPTGDLVSGVRGLCKLVKLELREVVPRRELFKLPPVNREEDVVRLLLRAVFSTSSFLSWTEVLLVSCFLFLSVDDPPPLLISLLSSPELNKLDLLLKTLDFVFSKLDFIPFIKKNELTDHNKFGNQCFFAIINISKSLFK